MQISRSLHRSNGRISNVNAARATAAAHVHYYRTVLYIAQGEVSIELWVLGVV